METFWDLEKRIYEFVIPADVHESYDLSRIKTALDKLDNPQDKLRVVHIAGTSGKTSTAYYASEILRQAGYKVGLSISPHLEEINERVQVDLIPLDEITFCASLEEFIRILESYKISLTYFELLVSFAFWYFAKIKVDIAVFEVGLGGLLDGTNVINREDKVCVITDISLDHTSVLGKSVEEIAKQKAGIIKNKNKVFCVDQSVPVIRIVEQTCKEADASLTIIKPEESSSALGYFQNRNFAVARAAAQYILDQDQRDPLSKEKLSAAKRILIPGRAEKLIINNKIVILDGAHNAQKLNGLLKSIEPEVSEKEVLAVLSVGKNKQDQLLEMAQSIEKITSNIMITSFDEKQDFERSSIEPEYLEQYFPNSDVEIIHDVKTAVTESIKRPFDVVLITGSLYLVGKAKKILRDLQ